MLVVLEQDELLVQDRLGVNVLKIHVLVPMVLLLQELLVLQMVS